MSYTKTNWQTGDVITAEKLNKLENGVEAASNGSIFYIYATREEDSQTGTYSYTNDNDAAPSEVYNAFMNGKFPILIINMGEPYLHACPYYTAWGTSDAVNGVTFCPNDGSSSYFFLNSDKTITYGPWD